MLALAASIIACAPVPSGMIPPVIRVMTYNIKSGNGALDSTAATIRRFAPDIVALQEVDVHWDARSDFADQATLLGEKLSMHVCFAPIYRIASATASSPMREFGVALLTKYPLVSCENRLITRLSTQQQNAVPRLMQGFLDAIVEVNGREVHVYDTHLDYRADPAVRRRQVADMLSYLIDSAAPTVLMGDLNAEPNAAELAPLFARLHDAWSASGGAGLTYPAEDPKKRIDYVLVSEHFRVKDASVPVTLASDHRPVVAELIFTPGKSSQAESDLFYAVAKTLKLDAGPVPLEIDPRPLRADPRVVDASAATRADVPDSVVQNRLGILPRLSISQTHDATTRGCAGVTTPPPLAGQVDPKDRCPDKESYVAAIGLPREGGAYFPGSPTDERGSGKRAGQVAVRVLFTHLAPYGSLTTAYDYVFARKPGRWTLVKREALHFRE